MHHDKKLRKKTKQKNTIAARHSASANKEYKHTFQNVSILTSFGEISYKRASESPNGEDLDLSDIATKTVTA